MPITQENLRQERRDHPGRLDRHFAANPAPLLTDTQKRHVSWATTATDCVAALRISHEHLRDHSYHVGAFVRIHEDAVGLLENAHAVVVVGPGFGQEINYLTPHTDAEIFAVEINPEAHPPLGAERPWLKILRNMDEVDAQNGHVVFVLNFLLAQPSLATDAALEQFASELLRIAPDEFSVFSILPLGCTYKNKTKFSTEPMFGDEILAENLKALGAHGTRAVKNWNGSPVSRMALLEVGAR
jgi:hypothetical protein